MRVETYHGTNGTVRYLQHILLNKYKIHISLTRVSVSYKRLWLTWRKMKEHRIPNCLWSWYGSYFTVEGIRVSEYSQNFSRLFNWQIVELGLKSIFLKSLPFFKISFYYFFSWAMSHTTLCVGDLGLNKILKKKCFIKYQLKEFLIAQIMSTLLSK